MAKMCLFYKTSRYWNEAKTLKVVTRHCSYDNYQILLYIKNDAKFDFNPKKWQFFEKNLNYFYMGDFFIIKCHKYIAFTQWQF